MRTATNKHKTSTVDPTAASDCESLSNACSSNEHIATAAYYKAEARGFAPGKELEDWLEAETEYRAVASS